MKWILILSLFAGIVSAESYLCIADESIGFDVSDNNSVARFNLDKYVVKSTENHKNKIYRDAYDYIVTKHGNKSTSFRCQIDSVNSNAITCGQEGRAFYLNKMNLRFITHYYGGYLSGRSNADDPNIEIGHCSGI